MANIGELSVVTIIARTSFALNSGVTEPNLTKYLYSIEIIDD